MPFTQAKCDKCGKVFKATKEYHIGSKLAYVGECGHLMVADSLKPIGAENIDNYETLDGKHPYPYQVEGVRFIEASGGRCLIMDEQGLGKTWQASIFLACHREAWPFAVICKSALKTQWDRELYRIIGDDDLMVQVVDEAKEPLWPKAAGYIFSFDALWRFEDDKNTKNGGTSLLEFFAKRGIKTVVIDECQQIKNTEAKRSMAVRKLTKDMPNVIALSGTPIKNNAGEFFSILNILKPKLYYNKSRFLQWECESVWDRYRYKVGGLRYPDQFKEKTKDFIIRRTREEVLPELPVVSRYNHFSDLADQVAKDYRHQMEMFVEEYDSAPSFDRSSNLMAYMAKMRHICGQSKIPYTLDFVMEFLESTERKLCIFVHHKDVGAELAKRIRESVYEDVNTGEPRTTEVLELKAGASDRDEIVKEFNSKTGARVMVASTLASGEGLNLQSWCDCVMHERQWNPANEEQAESRFIRIGQASSRVTANYMMAAATIDDYFGELVERKRQYCKSSYGEEYVQWDESSLMKELMETLATKGRQQWRL